MNIFTRIICLVLIISALIFVALRAPIKSQSARTQKLVKAEAEKITGDKFRYSTKSPKGVNVFSVNKPTAKMLTSIDKGFADLIKVAVKNGYYKRTDYSDYTVFIAKPDRNKDSKGNYSPDIAVNAAQYAGSKYDKGGYVYAAGMVVAFNPCAFVIAEHTQNFQRVSDVVRYESEHLVLYHNDRKRFKQTADHSKGGGHPILK